MSDSLRAPARPSNFLFLPLVLVIAFTGCVSSKAGSLAHDNAQKTAQADVQHEEEVVKKPSPKNILKTAFSQVGNPYRYGGASPETGFDCSGFVKWVYGQYDIRLPRSSGDMMSAGKVVDRKELKPGDLVFFGRKKRITHVGIYTGDDKYIHSPRTGKSIEESKLESRARGEYYAGARRILPSADMEVMDDELKRLRMRADGQADETAAPAPVEQAVETASTDGSAPGASEPGEEIQFVEPAGVPASVESAEIVIAENILAETTPVEAAAPPVEKAVAKPAPAKKHRVVAGDTLYGLARKYDVSSDALAKANNFNNKSKATLKLGQVLVIPGKADTRMAKSEAPAKTEAKTAQAGAPVKAETKAVPTTTETKAAQTESPAQTEIKVAEAPTQTASPEKATAVQQATGKIAAAGADKPAAAQKNGRHKVVAGDTIYALARKYEVSSEALAKANNFADKDKAVLKLGQVLVIPAKTSGSLKVAQSASADAGTSETTPQPAQVAAAKPKPAAAPTDSKKSRQHKVASGDTLYDLARKYGISTDALAKANNLDTKKSMLKLGQVLVVPPKTKAN